ncbi:MAG: efflux RND transporter periplasmic adaptor subunit [Lachnospiraceae bacterium]|nr:efflux RND transporter periplasmic adaptor subunit [Lachnospiraceae bacterium]
MLIVMAIVASASSCHKAAEPRLVTEEAQLRDLSSSVTATGTIEPVTSVEVGTQVSGIIDKIFVDYNSNVSKGQVIAELDKTNLMSELSNAKSNMANAESTLQYQQANYNRQKTLFDKGLISANDFEQARLSYEQARQQVQIERQNVAKAQTNLGYATIVAPIDGVVLSKQVEEGQTVAAAMTTPTLFIIAQDLTDMRVIADVDEADIGAVKEGQNVTFTVDAFPNDVFHGTVTQVRQEATTESNVVTYEVVIAARNDDLKLKPGLTANVNIYTFEKDNVLCVSSKALKFTPNPMMMPKDIAVEGTPDKPCLWVLDGKTLRATHVEVGQTGGSYTEILSGIKQGDKVAIEVDGSPMAADNASSEESNPFMPGPPGQKKNKK